MLLSYRVSFLFLFCYIFPFEIPYPLYTCYQLDKIANIISMHHLIKMGAQSFKCLFRFLFHILNALQLHVIAVGVRVWMCIGFNIFFVFVLALLAWQDLISFALFSLIKSILRVSHKYDAVWFVDPIARFFSFFL